MKKLLALVSAALLAAFLTSCNSAQVGASAAYVAAEVATTQILTKSPAMLPVAQALVADWAKFQGGTLTAQDEATLLQQVVAATKGKVSPTQAALLDGAVQQILANRNASAPTPLQGAAGAILTDVINGVGRAIVLYQTPAS
jgi:hypothetical protein